MTTVKHFHSAMTGAPVLSGTAGSLIAVLDACLVTGFGLKSADSVTLAGGIATVTFSTSHSFEPDTIALIAGATPTGLNGEKRVLTTSANSITFAAPGIANGAATGTITAKLAPAGFAKEFAGTNLAAYRSTNMESTRMFLRVDDTGTTNARVVGYESMSDVNTGVGPFPTATQISGGGWWPKANSANTTARAWTVVADSKVFYLHVSTVDNTGASGSVWTFGDFASLKSGDAYACVLQAAREDIAQIGGSGVNAIAANGASLEYTGGNYSGPLVARSYTTLGGGVYGQHAPDGGASGVAAGVSGGDFPLSSSPTYPNGPDNGLILVRKLILEPTICRRGSYRGLYLAPQKCHGSFSWCNKIDGQGELAGRKLLAIKCGSPASTVSQGVLFIDITGPWG